MTVDEKTVWKRRIQTANDYYNKWSNLFSCKVLEDYYEGRQWQYNRYFTERPYQVNKVYSTIKIKAANLLLSYPEYKVSPRPGNADYSQEMAMLSAQRKEDVLNTIIDDDKEEFALLCNLVFLDSQFRFGVAEVGYAADYLRNPLAEKPLLNTQVEGNDDVDEVKIERQPDQLPENERIYFKRILAKRFRVGSADQPVLSRCNWYGYYEFYLLDDVKSIFLGDKDATEKLENVGETYHLDEDTDPVTFGSTSAESAMLLSGAKVKIWHIWDTRAKKRLMVLDSTGEVIWSDDFKRCPIFDLRWDLRLEGFYPLPPVFQQISPQDEYNEARQQMRSHRRRYVRKFQCIGDLDEDEIDKFTSGEDGTIIKVQRDDQIKPIQNPEVGAAVKEALVVSTEDFNEVAGISNQDRSRSDRTTATESQRLAMKADVRESAEDAIIQRWMVRMGREALLVMQERFVMGTWAKLGSDPGEDILGEVNEDPSYQYITSEQLDDGYDFRINVNIISSSPMKNEEEKRKFVEFLALVTQFPQIALSPRLIREAAYRVGYRNERIIKEMQQQALLMKMGQLQQAGATAGPEGNQIAQAKVAQMTPNTIEQVRNQLGNQLQ